MGFKELSKRLKEINKEALKQEAVRMNGDLIADLNAKQMREGKDARNKPIRPKYSDAYKARKQKQGYSGDGTPDLFLDGDFQNDMDTVVSGDKWFTTSFDEKTQILTGRYGDDIFGLTPKNFKTIQIPVTEDYIKLWAKEAGL